MTAGARAAPAVLAAALLAGCAAGSPARGSHDAVGEAGGASPPAAVTPTIGGATADAPAPSYTIEIDAPAPLRELLATHLDLERFRRDDAAAAAITPLELRRLVAATPAQARALLETEGYFDARVTAERDDGTPPVVRIAVEPGPRTTIERVTLDVQGELGAAVERGDVDAARLVDALRRGWTLRAGEPFTQGAWSAAKSAALAQLRAEGHPLATWSGTGVQVDAPTQRARIFVVADSGPKFRLGELRVEGLERYGEAAVRNLAQFGTGDVYRESTVADFQERLQKAGLFEAVSVDVATDAQRADAAPVVVRVRELPLQQATVGVGVSANTGPRVSLEHVHRRAFGRALTAKNKFEIGRDLKQWEGELTTHPLPDLYRDLVAANVERLAVEGEVRDSWRLRAGRAQDTQRIERLYFAELIGATTKNAAGSSTAQAASLNYHWVWRDLDSIVLPTRGITASAQVSGGHAQSNFADSGPYARAVGRLTGYWPLPGRWFGQGRVEAGEVFADAGVGIPDPLLFRAGGDDSVRGYDYRSLGPLRGGVLTSGRVLLTTSVELARPISEKLPNYWVAAFVDAGNAADDWADLRPAVGYGVGLRWRSPVGPLRFDVAYGREVRSVRLHFSVGIAF
jgi:translocation and assembly module TamA